MGSVRPEIILKEESYAVIGAYFEVYNHHGSGFLEAVYHECLELELSDRSIPYRSRAKVPIAYKGRPVACLYEADLICFDAIVLELKAMTSLDAVHEAQLMHYLKATRLPLSILVNFGRHPELQYKRIAFSHPRSGNC